MKIYNYFKNVSEIIKLKNVDETRNYFLEELKQNELISRKHKNAFTSLNHIENFLILASKITACTSCLCFVFSIFATRFCAIAAGVKANRSQ